MPALPTVRAFAMPPFLDLNMAYACKPIKVVKNLLTQTKVLKLNYSFVRSNNATTI